MNINDSSKALYVPHQLCYEKNVQSFLHSYDDTVISAGPELARPELITALTSNSAPAIEWLIKSFGVDLSLVSRLGGHSIPRTHRGAGGAPGWAITSALIKKLTAEEERAKILKNAKVVKLLQSGDQVTGVECETGQGENVKLEGSVIIATG